MKRSTLFAVGLSASLIAIPALAGDSGKTALGGALGGATGAIVGGNLSK